jgi:hypothetical protein
MRDKEREIDGKNAKEPNNEEGVSGKTYIMATCKLLAMGIIEGRRHRSRVLPGCRKGMAHPHSLFRHAWTIVGHKWQEIAQLHAWQSLIQIEHSVIITELSHCGQRSMIASIKRTKWLGGVASISARWRPQH